MENELKPCPFCGEVPTVELFEDMFHRSKFGIECHGSNCDILPGTAWYADKQEAIEAWNRRAENEELKFTREFIHKHGLEFALASAWRGRCTDGT